MGCGGSPTAPPAGLSRSAAGGANVLRISDISEHDTTMQLAEAVAGLETERRIRLSENLSERRPPVSRAGEVRGRVRRRRSRDRRQLAPQRAGRSVGRAGHRRAGVLSEVLSARSGPLRPGRVAQFGGAGAGEAACAVRVADGRLTS
jgi:hypothetical protein